MVQIRGKEEIDNMSFEKAIEELEIVVSELERGEISLEDTISAYEYGTLLRKRAEGKLSEAQERIEKLKVQDGEIVGTDKVLGMGSDGARKDNN